MQKKISEDESENYSDYESYGFLYVEDDNKNLTIIQLSTSRSYCSTPHPKPRILNI